MWVPSNKETEDRWQPRFFLSGSNFEAKEFIVYPNDLEHCCGAVEIGCFNGPTKEIRSQILGLIEDYATNHENGDLPTPGALIATTVPDQTTAISALKSLRFRRALTFLNPGTGRNVTLWVKKLTY